MKSQTNDPTATPEGQLPSPDGQLADEKLDEVVGGVRKAYPWCFPWPKAPGGDDI
jgi:hypothetical protein